MRRRHRWLVALGLLLAVVGWLAWTILVTESE